MNSVVDETQYMHQIPFEMWSMYVEGRAESVKSICGLNLKPEIPLDETKPRCPKCWRARWTKEPEALLGKKYKTRAFVIEAIQVNPDADGQIAKVLEWGEQNSAHMAWLGVGRGLHVEVDGRSFEVPSYDFLVKDLVGNVTNIPSWLFWSMYEEVE